MEHLSEYKGLWFHENTAVEVKNCIAESYNTKRKIRIHYGCTVTGGLWLEEHDVIGKIGRSTGEVKIPLLIEGNSDGGGGILDRCIIGIQDAKTKEWLYRSKVYTEPDLNIRPCNVSITRKGKPVKLTHIVVRGAYEEQAAFESLEKAKNYIAFMRGERMRVS